MGRKKKTKNDQILTNSEEKSNFVNAGSGNPPVKSEQVTDAQEALETSQAAKPSKKRNRKRSRSKPKSKNQERSDESPTGKSLGDIKKNAASNSEDKACSEKSENVGESPDTGCAVCDEKKRKENNCVPPNENAGDCENKEANSASEKETNKSKVSDAASDGEDRISKMPNREGCDKETFKSTPEVESEGSTKGDSRRASRDSPEAVKVIAALASEEDISLSGDEAEKGERCRSQTLEAAIAPADDNAKDKSSISSGKNNSESGGVSNLEFNKTEDENDIIESKRLKSESGDNLEPKASEPTESSETKRKKNIGGKNKAMLSAFLAQWQLCNIKKKEEAQRVIEEEAKMQKEEYIRTKNKALIKAFLIQWRLYVKHSKEMKAKETSTKEDYKEQLDLKEKVKRRLEKLIKEKKSSVTPQIKNSLEEVQENEQNQGIFLKSRPVFMPNACAVCLALNEGDVRLKYCGNCKMIAYCGSPHQKQHWKEHKDVCLWVKKELERGKKNHIFAQASKLSDRKRWKQLRYQTMIDCERSISRSLTIFEKEMFLFPRICRVCLLTDQDVLKSCGECHSINYCRADHVPSNHKEWCKQLRLLLDINVYQHSHGLLNPPLPYTCFQKYEPLSDSIKEFLVTRVLGPKDIMTLGKLLFAALTEVLSFPLTVIHALEAFHAHQRKSGASESNINKLESLTIHLVGAELGCEGDGIAKWDIFVMNVLPNLRKLRLVFIGPELSTEAEPLSRGVLKEDLRCENSREKGNVFQLDLQPGITYHEYCESLSYTRADLVVAFNCNIHRDSLYGKPDTWSATLPYLTRQAGVPLLLTAYSELDAARDVEVVKSTSEHSVGFVMHPQRNSYRSHRPILNYIDDHNTPVIFRNNYVSLLLPHS